MASSNRLPSSPMAPTHTKSGLASLMRLAIGPNSRLPNSHSRKSTSCRPRFLMVSRAPIDMKWMDGNLLVTTATVLGGLGPLASASNTVLVVVTAGGHPRDHPGECIAYLAGEGAPRGGGGSTLF